MSFVFTPISETAAVKVPHLEDARADYAPYYSTNKTVEEVQAEIVIELGKLGGYGVGFQAGKFGEKPVRYGFIVHFYYNNRPGMIRVAGLPMHSETDKKRRQVQAQALCIARDWIKAQVTAKVFMPGVEPLIQFLLVNGDQTVTDYMMLSGRLPDGKQISSGGVEEVKVEIVDN